MRALIGWICRTRSSVSWLSYRTYIKGINLLELVQYNSAYKINRQSYDCHFEGASTRFSCHHHNSCTLGFVGSPRKNFISALFLLLQISEVICIDNISLVKKVIDSDILMVLYGRLEFIMFALHQRRILDYGRKMFINFCFLNQIVL